MSCLGISSTSERRTSPALSCPVLPHHAIPTPRSALPCSPMALPYPANVTAYPVWPFLSWPTLPTSQTALLNLPCPALFTASLTPSHRHTSHLVTRGPWGLVSVCTTWRPPWALPDGGGGELRAGLVCLSLVRRHRLQTPADGPGWARTRALGVSAPLIGRMEPR